LNCPERDFGPVLGCLGLVLGEWWRPHDLACTDGHAELCQLLCEFMNGWGGILPFVCSGCVRKDGEHGSCRIGVASEVGGHAPGIDLCVFGAEGPPCGCRLAAVVGYCVGICPALIYLKVRLS
jgi:hypothetical protein